MSLSRPARFPLLKLPWLCIKCVLHNSDEFILIYFATISDRTRRIVRSSNYPLKEIDVVLSRCTKISINNQFGKTEDEKPWYFKNDKNADNGKIVLQGGPQPFRTSRHFDTWRGHNLQSCTTGDKLDVMRMGVEFMIDVFRCSIKRVFVDGHKLSELLGLGISSVGKLHIRDPGPVVITDLKNLLKTIEVTDSFVFDVQSPKDYFCDPRIFKCRRIDFACIHSADWVTFEILCQLDVPQLSFWFHRFSIEDIVSYVTHWFNSENRKLEYVQFEFDNPVSLDNFKIEHLNPMPFDEKRRNRCALVDRGYFKWNGHPSSRRDVGNILCRFHNGHFLCLAQTFSGSCLTMYWVDPFHSKFSLNLDLSPHENLNIMHLQAFLFYLI